MLDSNLIIIYLLSRESIPGAWGSEAGSESNWAGYTLIKDEARRR